VDPGLKEEMISKATLTVIANAHKELCCMQKSGGIPVAADVVCLHSIYMTTCTTDIVTHVAMFVYSY
jgi:exosome complex RNA-binding protein Rrp42 (RNase PH superfamily)